MIYIKKKRGGTGRQGEGNPNPSVKYYSCTTEHTTKSAIQEGWALAHFVQNTVFSFDLTPPTPPPPPDLRVSREGLGFLFMLDHSNQ